MTYSQTDTKLEELEQAINRSLASDYEDEDFYDEACELLESHNYDLQEVGEIWDNSENDLSGKTVEVHESDEFRGMMQFRFGDLEEVPHVRYTERSMGGTQ